MGNSLERALARTEIRKFGEVSGIPSEPVDGMDVLAVRDVVGRAVERTRTDKSPALIEARTYRFRGHRSEEHTSELQSQSNLVCRLLLEKKKSESRYTDNNTICMLVPTIELIFESSTNAKPHPLVSSSVMCFIRLAIL